MALTKKRRAILNGVKRQIRASIKRAALNASGGYKFNMNEWITVAKVKATTKNGIVPLRDGFCGTAGCLAGSIAVQEGYLPKFHPDVYFMGMPETQATYDGIWQKNGRGTKRSIKEAGQHELGLSDWEASMLFLPMDHESNVWHGLDYHNPAHAIEAINRFIKLDGKIEEYHYSDDE